MRLTIDIPSRLHSKLKKRAKLEGTTLSDLVCKLVAAPLERNPGRRVHPPIIHSDRPGSLKLDNAKIFELIDFP